MSKRSQIAVAIEELQKELSSKKAEAAHLEDMLIRLKRLDTKRERKPKTDKPKAEPPRAVPEHKVS